MKPLVINKQCDIFDQPSPPKTPTCAVVGSRLDYANAMSYGVSSKNINRLKRIQHGLARYVVELKLHRIRQLHWLPIQHCIKFHIAKFAFLARPSAIPVRITAHRSLVIRRPYITRRSSSCSSRVLKESTVCAGFVKLRQPF